MEVEKLADSSTTTLYFANIPYYAADRQYLPCLAGIPTIDRSSGKLEEPGRLPTYGDISLNIKPEFKPDPENTLEWNLLLFKDTYNFQGRSLVIKMGATDDAVDNFQTIFTGYVGQAEWDDYYLQLTVYDKLRLLENSIPDFELPESIYVDPDAWGAIPPMPLGYVKNMSPLYLNQPAAGQGKFVLGAGVINNVLAVYQNNIELSGVYMTFNQKDVSPAFKQADGAFRMETFGPYTGSAQLLKWLIQIDDISGGSEVGQATFRWSIDGGVTWEAEGVPTWNLEYNPATLQKTTAVGNAVMSVGGSYTGIDTSRTYVVECTQSGVIGVLPYPTFRWSDDGGDTWSAEIDLDSGGPFSLSYGLTVSFTESGAIAIVEETRITEGYCLISPGSFWAESGSYGDTVLVEIGRYAGGPVFGSGAYRLGFDLVPFGWSVDGGANWNYDYVPVTWEFPYEMTLFGSFVISFGYAYDYFCAGEQFLITTEAAGSMEDGDIWTFETNKQAPIELADGVSVQFYTDAGQDFYLADEAEFILWSTLTVTYDVEAGNAITCDVEGLLDSEGNYQDEIVPVLRMVLENFCSWTAADFDEASLNEFAAEFPYIIGYLMEDLMPVGDILTDLLTGFPAIYSVDFLGRFYLKELVLPAAPAVLTLNADQRDFTELPYNTLHEQNPKKRVFVRYDRNWTVNRNPAGVAVAFGEWLKREFRQVVARNHSVAATYRNAGELGPLETCVVERADAQELANKWLALFQEMHQDMEVQCEARAAMLKPGEVVEIVRDAFGMESGLAYLVTGTEFELLANDYRLTLWR